MFQENTLRNWRLMSGSNLKYIIGLILLILFTAVSFGGCGRKGPPRPPQEFVPPPVVIS